MNSLCVAVFAATGIIAVFSACPVDWAEYKGECMYFGHDRRSWLDAESHCRKMHAYLVTDDDPDKHTFLSKVASVLHSLRQTAFWIGASDYTIEGSFRWLETGYPVGNFTAWGAGRPTRNDTNNCVRLFYNGDQFKWEDFNCNDRNTYFICEKPAPGGASATTESALVIGK